MDPYEETFETWNRLADLYKARFMDLNLYDDGYDYFCNALNKGPCRVLEIGCGPGNISRYLLGKRPDILILGIDVAPDMLKIARRENPGGTFQILDARNLCQLNGNFHGIISGFCLPYLSLIDIAGLLIECHRLLTEGAPLYLSFVDGDPENSGFQQGADAGRCFFYYHQTVDVLQLLNQNGFVLQNQISVEYSNSKIIKENHLAIMAKRA